jgi:hypothetical protein
MENDAQDLRDTSVITGEFAGGRLSACICHRLPTERAGQAQ